MKDPAFLFYSRDFYEGTRMMLPEERGCYIDLMIYQHQNGYIPDDIKRLKMYCSGVDEATLKATLEGKFKRCSKGWYNERLKNEISERESFKEEQSISGKIGQFWKRIYTIFSKNEIKKLKEILSKDLILNLLDEYDISNKGTLKGSFKQRLNNIIANANANEDIDDNEDEGKIFTKKTFRKTLIEAGANEKHLEDWFAVRDKTKSPYTETALNLVLNQCKDNNFPVAKAVQICAERGWRSFKYEWIKNDDNGKFEKNNGAHSPGRELNFDNP